MKNSQTLEIQDLTYQILKIEDLQIQDLACQILKSQNLAYQISKIYIYCKFKIWTATDWKVTIWAAKY